MSAPSRVLTNGVTPISVGGGTGIVDETYIAGTVTTTIFAVEDFSFEPKRTHVDTMDADQAITMRKSTTPVAVLTMKGKVKSLTGGLIIQCPGTSITTTISGGSLALANFPASAICGFLPTDGLIILDSLKYTQKRLQTQLEADLALTHLPHAA